MATKDALWFKIKLVDIKKASIKVKLITKQER